MYLCLCTIAITTSSDRNERIGMYDMKDEKIMCFTSIRMNYMNLSLISVYSKSDIDMLILKLHLQAI